MNTEKNERDEQRSTRDWASKPDEETLHNTDPQDHMKGPMSSPTHDTGEQFDTEETKREADREKDKRM